MCEGLWLPSAVDLLHVLLQMHFAFGQLYMPLACAVVVFGAAIVVQLYCLCIAPNLALAAKP